MERGAGVGEREVEVEGEREREGGYESVFLPVESDRNEVRHTDPGCTLLLLLLPVLYSANGSRGAGLARKIRMETAAYWVLYLATGLYKS